MLDSKMSKTPKACAATAAEATHRGKLSSPIDEIQLGAVWINHLHRRNVNKSRSFKLAGEENNNNAVSILLHYYLKSVWQCSTLTLKLRML
jgi:hypothetical protein